MAVELAKAVGARVVAISGGRDPTDHAVRMLGADVKPAHHGLVPSSASRCPRSRVRYGISRHHDYPRPGWNIRRCRPGHPDPRDRALACPSPASTKGNRRSTVFGTNEDRLTGSSLRSALRGSHYLPGHRSGIGTKAPSGLPLPGTDLQSDANSYRYRGTGSHGQRAPARGRPTGVAPECV